MIDLKIFCVYLTLMFTLSLGDGTTLPRDYSKEIIDSSDNTIQTAATVTKCSENDEKECDSDFAANLNDTGPLDSHEAMNTREFKTRSKRSINRDKKSFRNMLLGAVPKKKQTEDIKEKDDPPKFQSDASELLLELMVRIASHPQQWNEVHSLLQKIDQDLSTSKKLISDFQINNNFVTSASTTTNPSETTSDHKLIILLDEPNQIVLKNNTVGLSWPNLDETPQTVDETQRTSETHPIKYAIQQVVDEIPLNGDETHPIRDEILHNVDETHPIRDEILQNIDETHTIRDEIPLHGDEIHPFRDEAHSIRDAISLNGDEIPPIRDEILQNRDETHPIRDAISRNEDEIPRTRDDMIANKKFVQFPTSIHSYVLRNGVEAPQNGDDIPEAKPNSNEMKSTTVNIFPWSTKPRNTTQQKEFEFQYHRVTGLPLPYRSNYDKQRVRNAYIAVSVIAPKSRDLDKQDNVLEDQLHHLKPWSHAENLENMDRIRKKWWIQNKQMGTP